MRYAAMIRHRAKSLRGTRAAPPAGRMSASGKTALSSRAVGR
jgi:hypothetical protein